MTGSAGVPPAGHHRGWYSRGYLPHLDFAPQTQFITFRLHDSLPQVLLDRWAQELERMDEEEQAREMHRRMMHALDGGHGACYLRRPEIAAVVQQSLLHFDGERYQLFGWAIMPNHVHVLARILPGNELPRVVHSWKSFSAHRANKLLGRSGAFWYREFYDRYIRDAVHFETVLSYVLNNPVKAKLCARPEEWPFSSARYLERSEILSRRDAGAPGQ